MKRKLTVRRKAEKKARKAAKKAAREAENRKSAKGRAEKRDVKVKTVEDRLCWKLVGLALVAAAVFLALALATFDWESVRTLCENPHETRNPEEEYNQAKAIVIEANRASVSLLQQRMRIGYNHASRMIDLLEKRGVIGPHRGAGPREVLVG